TLVQRWDDLDEGKRREAVELIAFDAERGAAMTELVVAISRAASGRQRRPERGRLEDAGASVSAAFARIDERPDVLWEATGDVAVDQRTLHAIAFVLVDVASVERKAPLAVASEISPDAVSVSIARDGASSADGGAMAIVRRAAAAVGGGLEAHRDGRLVLRLPR
ncbi:MAG TPA: hypothetical protein VG709_01865, partial [Actinomycetota bacterium]|nr:hypothetical protein [Actinomycetota bacterium]